jgi:Ni,Fe-hydrogenase maturation factor
MHREHSGWNPFHARPHGGPSESKVVRKKPGHFVLVFGNPLVREDSLALRILPRLRKQFPSVEFVELDAVEELTEYGQHLIILDVAKGVEKPAIITDLKDLELDRVLTMHGFDLAWNLKILETAGQVKSVKIIALPYNMDEPKALDAAAKLIKKIRATD